MNSNSETESYGTDSGFESDCSSDDDDISFTELFSIMSRVDEDVLLSSKGYKKVETLCQTLQGSLLKVQHMDSDQFFAVKKTDKQLRDDSIYSENGTHFCVTEDIVKEAQILKHLTVDNKSLDDTVVNYIDFLESETDYYLVMEYCESETNLRQFAQDCHRKIFEGRLSLKKYQKCMKRIFWQLMSTVHWLHNDMNCAHLDLCMENVMLTDCDLSENKRGNLSINKDISIKLADFGVSEVFAQKSDFACQKSPLSWENEVYAAPKVFSEEIYEAHKVDCWNIGMLLFECLAGQPLYRASEILDKDTKCVGSSYWALHNDEFETYLGMNNLLQYFNSNSMAVVDGLLKLDSDKRHSVTQCIESAKWFNKFNAKYSQYITEKSVSQKQALLEQTEGMKEFPFYQF